MIEILGSLDLGSYVILRIPKIRVESGIRYIFGSGSRSRILKSNFPDPGSSDPDHAANFFGSGSSDPDPFYHEKIGSRILFGS